uniref:Conotoxin Superfamily S n=1 Tax=Conus episcopatus TaxID=88764 RepID=A0A0K2S7J5_CONEP|nr:Conotoxin Superfamily S [Conus episcopatus]
MMSKLGAMFVLLLLFTLASSQEKGDVQAGKTQKSDFYRTLTRSARGCTMSCAFQNNICQGTCHCSGSPVIILTRFRNDYHKSFCTTLNQIYV